MLKGKTAGGAVKLLSMQTEFSSMLCAVLGNIFGDGRSGFDHVNAQEISEFCFKGRYQHAEQGNHASVWRPG